MGSGRDEHQPQRRRSSPQRHSRPAVSLASSPVSSIPWNPHRHVRVHVLLHRWAVSIHPLGEGQPVSDVPYLTEIRSMLFSPMSSFSRARLATALATATLAAVSYAQTAAPAPDA